MKLNRLETHDRLQHLKKDQSVNVFKGAEDCLKSNTLSMAIQEKSPYVYIFAHPRTADDGANKVMYWQPRMSKPQAQTNSYLFRAKSKTDIIEVCWLIPPRELWDQYKIGNLMESDLVGWSIWQFNYNRETLESPHPEDMTELEARAIMKSIIDEHRQGLKNNKILIDAQMQKNNDEKIGWGTN